MALTTISSTPSVAVYSTQAGARISGGGSLPKQSEAYTAALGRIKALESELTKAIGMNAELRAKLEGEEGASPLSSASSSSSDNSPMSAPSSSRSIRASSLMPPTFAPPSSTSYELAINLQHKEIDLLRSRIKELQVERRPLLVENEVLTEGVRKAISQRDDYHEKWLSSDSSLRKALNELSAFQVALQKKSEENKKLRIERERAFHERDACHRAWTLSEITLQNARLIISTLEARLRETNQEKDRIAHMLEKLTEQVTAARVIK